MKMMHFGLIIGLLMSAGFTLAQSKEILVFDLFNGTVDSIAPVFAPDDITKEITPYHLGNYSTTIAPLFDDTPVDNVFPESNFTLKKRITDDFDITNFPLRAIVKAVRIVDGEQGGSCSGTIVSRRHVITAAHCISGLSSDTITCDSIIIYPTYTNGLIHPDFEEVYVQKVYFFKNWSLSGEDMALLELEEPLGDYTGWLSIGFDEDKEAMKNELYYKFSYPAITFPAIDPNEYNGDTLYYNYGKVDVINENLIGITGASGIPGESGSGIIQVRNNEAYTLFGVLSTAGLLAHSQFNADRFYAFHSILSSELSVPTFNKENMSVYPNPTSGMVWIGNSGKTDITHVEVWNLHGQLIKAIPDFNPYFELDLSELPQGVYFLNIQTTQGVYTTKLVKQ